MPISAAQLTANISVTGADTAKAQLISVGESANSTSGMLKNALGGIAIAAGAAVVGMGVASVKMAGDFQEGMTSLVTGAGESQKNLKQVSDGILNLAVQTGTSTKQLTDGMYMIESAGFHGAAGLDILKAAAEGAKVGNADLGTVAGAVTTVMHDYANSHYSAIQATNALITTVASGKTHMQDLSNSLATVLPLASSLHIPFEQVAGAVATMTNAGMPAQRATQNLAFAIRALNVESTAGSNALDGIGLSAEQVHNSLVNKGLPETLQLIEDHIGKKFPLSSMQGQQALKDILGGATGLNVALMIGGDHMKEYTSDVASIGSALSSSSKDVQGWNLVTQDFNFQLARAKEVVEALGIKFGTLLLPIVGKVLDVFSNFATNLANSVGPALQNIQQKLTPFKSLFDQIHNVVGIVKLEFESTFNYLLFALDPVTQKMQSLSKGFSNVTPFVNEAKKLVGDFSIAFVTAAQNISRFLVSIDLTSFFNTISSGAAKIDFKQIINDGKILGQIFFNLSPAVNIFQALSSHAQELGKWFTTSVLPAVKGAEPGFKSLGQAIAGLLPAFLTISTVVHDVFQKAFDALLPVFMKAIPIIIQITGLIAAGLGAAIKFLTPYVVEATTAIVKFAGDILQRVAPIVTQFFDQIKQALDWLHQYWPQIWGTLAPFLQALWDDIVGIVKIAWALVSGIIKIGLDILGGNWSQAWNDFKDMLGGIWSGIKSIIKAGINEMIGVLNLGIDALNAFIDSVENALNSVAKAVGLGAPIPVTSIPLIPAYAEGTPTGGHPGGAALVGERGPEIAVLPKGTSVIPANLTKQILSGVPAYADGTGNILDNLMSWVSGGAQSILDNILKGLGLNLNLGTMSSLGGGIVDTIKKWALDWINKTLMPKLGGMGGSAGPGQAVNIPGSLMDWIMSAIGLTGVPANWAQDIAVIAMHESGGNPNAINNWDINAQEGHPSQGIMQTIPSTFAANMVAGHGNILNPIDNIAAGIRYIQSRYGSVFNVPGIVSMSSGGPYVGYADGTNFAPGGWSWVGERGKELMYVPRGAQIVPHQQLNTVAQQPQITVNPPGVYLDGRILVNGLMPYIADAIRYNTGTHNI